MRLSRSSLGVVVLAAVTVLPTAAQAQAEVVKSAHEFVDAFNKGDAKGAVAACADAVAIVDEFAPFVWHGVGACATWMKDFDADATRRGVTDGMVTPVSYTHLRAHETPEHLVCRLLLE